MASILKVDTIQDQSGNNIINENADTITIGASGDTITVPTGATFSAPGIANTPAFFAYRAGSAVSIPDNTNTLLIMDTEVFDTNSAFDTSTGFFTPQESGKYYVFAQFRLNTATNIDNVECVFRVNGSVTTPNIFSSIYNSQLNTTQVSGIVTLNGSTDYVAPYGVQYSGGPISTSTNGIYFYGYKLIGV